MGLRNFSLLLTLFLFFKIVVCAPSAKASDRVPNPTKCMNGVKYLTLNFDSKGPASGNVDGYKHDAALYNYTVVEHPATYNGSLGTKGVTYYFSGYSQPKAISTDFNMFRIENQDYGHYYQLQSFDAACIRYVTDGPTHVQNCTILVETLNEYYVDYNTGAELFDYNIAHRTDPKFKHFEVRTPLNEAGSENIFFSIVGPPLGKYKVHFGENSILLDNIVLKRNCGSPHKNGEREEGEE